MPLPGKLLIVLLALTALAELVLWARNRRIVSRAFAMDEVLAVLQNSPVPLGVSGIAKETFRHSCVVGRAVAVLYHKGLIGQPTADNSRSTPNCAIRYFITPAGTALYEGNKSGKILPP